jgi:hypothetical protein
MKPLQPTQRPNKTKQTHPPPSLPEEEEEEAKDENPGIHPMSCHPQPNQTQQHPL